MRYLTRSSLAVWWALAVFVAARADAQTSFNPSRAATRLTAAEERALQPRDTFKECDVCPEMVVAPAGSFIMGSSPEEIDALAKASPNEKVSRQLFQQEGPQHRVTVARPFAVGKFEVTFAEWDACLAEDGCRTKPKDRWGRGSQPVFRVPWHAVTSEYMPWLSRKTGKTYRLLSEAEWEYAARAGSTTRYHFGNDERDLCTYGNGADLTTTEKIRDIDWTHFANCRDGFANTAPVGSFPPNGFGLHDMHGNINEWVQDCWNGNYEGAPSDGSAWTTGDCNCRIVRGGSSGSGPRWLRSASRGKDCTNFFPVNAFGFRVARTLAP